MSGAHRDNDHNGSSLRCPTGTPGWAAEQDQPDGIFELGDARRQPNALVGVTH
jgi:hypothetical protein